MVALSLSLSLSFSLSLSVYTHTHTHTHTHIFTNIDILCVVCVSQGGHYLFGAAVTTVTNTGKYGGDDARVDTADGSCCW